jgi:N-acyl-L-homoserine lactone synthetase
MSDHDQQPPQMALKVLDDVCNRLMMLCEPIRFDVARSPIEREAIYRLRYREVIERGWSQPEDFPDGLERDAYDERAVQVVGWDGETLVAAVRLVLQADELLPTEAAFDLVVEPRGKVADAGRTIVAPAYRDPQQHKVLLGLLGRTALETSANGFTHLCGSMSEPVQNLYRKIGIDVSILGPARQYWGEKRYPCRYDLLRSAFTISQWLANAATR